MANHGHQLARRYLERFRDALRHLALLPSTGMICPELGPYARAWAVPPYEIFYRTERTYGPPTILRVLHARRDGNWTPGPPRWLRPGEPRGTEAAAAFDAGLETSDDPREGETNA